MLATQRRINRTKVKTAKRTKKVEYKKYKIAAIQSGIVPLPFVKWANPEVEE